MRSGQKRADARSVACAFAALLAALASGCTTSNTSNASLTTSAASGATIAFESIDGPPVGIFNRLVDNLSSEAQARNLAIASREGAANYRVRGYLAAQVIRGRTHISWVWDVYDDDKLRALRITGEEAGGRGGGDPWSVADEPMLRRIARTSMDRLAAYLGNPAGPLDSDASTAIAATPEPEPPAKPRRRPRSAATPTAAEQLALSASR
ncbi:MAG: hypothetical protein E6G97_00620 [Alphaproteobacteria bacterium]|nr:MAG: hypothetical protein E6G97_00620 [Alphaproteobacteria bacterium]